MVSAPKLTNHCVPRPQFPIRCGNFGDLAINKGYMAYFSMHMHETALFLLPVWNLMSPLCSSTRINDAWIPAIREHLRQKNDIFMFEWIFSTFWPKMLVLGQNSGMGGATLTPNKLVLTFGSCYLCATFGKKSIKKCNRESADRQTDRQTVTESNWIYNLSHAIAMGQIKSTGQRLQRNINKKWHVVY